jgi:TATA-box binding protein (TBP) (component of TFIID and TFIIIB)
MATSLLSELKPPAPGCLPGRMVNVAAHASLFMPELNAPVGYLNVGYLAVLGEIGMKYNKAQFGAGQVCELVHISTASGAKIPQVVTVLVFESGKLIFTGGEHEYGTIKAAHMFAVMLGGVVKIPITIGSFSVNNIVFNYFLQFEVDLQRFSQSQGLICAYDPVKFPAIIYRFANKFAALINYTGRVIITGSRSREVTAHAYENLYHKLVPYCAGPPPPQLTREAQPLDGQVVGYVPRPGALQEYVRGDRESRVDTFMRMNHQYTMLHSAFAERGDPTGLSAEPALRNIARAAPELGVGEFLDEFAQLRRLQEEAIAEVEVERKRGRVSDVPNGQAKKRARKRKQ